jgi:hypothetical protein
MLSVALFLTFSALPMGPDLPPGCDSTFSNTCQRVEEALESSNFKLASEMASWLPGRTLKITWDDTKVPVRQKAAFVNARDRAFALWRKAVPSLSFSVKANGDIAFRFEPQIPIHSGDAFAPGASYKVSILKGRRVMGTLSLVRGSKAEAITVKDVQNEVGYAIGLYVGLAQSPLYSHMMGRTEQPNHQDAAITPDEATWANACLKVADILREAIRNKKPLKAARPIVHIDPIDPKETSLLQGDQSVYKLSFQNQGNAQLNYRMTSTCSCLIGTPSGQVQAGQGAQIDVKFDSKEFKGDLVKHIYLYTNDINQPIVEIPIVAHITPRYRFLAPLGNFFLLEGKEVAFDVFWVLPDKADLKPLRWSIDGIEGSADLTPWKGELADPELKEGVKPRTGYKITIHIPDQMIFGRKPGLLTITTEDLAFRTVVFAFTIQKGIAVAPIQLYMGTVSPGTKSVGILSRPGKAFKVVGVNLTETYLEAHIEPGKDDTEYRLVVEYKGKAPKGVFRALVKVTTDDPQQPEVLVPVRGVVK